MQRRAIGDGSALRSRTSGHRARSRAVIAGLLSVAALGALAPAASATTGQEWAVANNIYPMMRAAAGHLQSTYGLTAFSSTVTSQAGGYWRDGASDSTTLRGITSGNVRQQLLGAGPYSTCNPTSPTNPNPNCEQGPLQIDAFFSADQGNVNQVIPNGSNGGTCTTGGSITTCPGIASTKRAIATGKLVIYSCNSSYNGSGGGASQGSPGSPGGAVNGSGNGAVQSPRCDSSAVTLSSNNMAGVVDWLDDAPGNKVAIASPGTAPFGDAAAAALAAAGVTVTPGTNAFAGSDCEAQSSGVCKIRLEAGISQVRGSVASGTAAVGLAALGNMKKVAWTSGPISGTTADDPNVWTVVPTSAYTSYGLINEYGVCIHRNPVDSARETACADVLSHWPDTPTNSDLADFGF